MNSQSRRDAKNAELMGDDIVGIYLSTEKLCDSHGTMEESNASLRRFVHDEENICNLRLLGRGEHGVVVLGSIKNSEYALKVVSVVLLRACCIANNALHSSRNGNNQAQRSTRTNKPSTFRRLHAKVEPLLD